MMEKISFEGLHKKPRSRKGWQEWHRKYALAFLHDQLDRVNLTVKKKNSFMSHFTKWEKRFRAECAGDQPEQRCGKEHNLLEDQIDFVTEYIACALCDGTEKGNLERIDRFLEMQRSSNIDERMELRFCDGSPLEAYTYVDSLKDIDIADVFYITHFDLLYVSRDKNKLWSKRAANRFLEDIKKDVLFDIPDAVIMAEMDDPTCESEFIISVQATEDDMVLKTLQCMPPAFINRFAKY